MVMLHSAGTAPETLQSYYTQSNDIVSYMTSLLNLKSEMKVWEPCAGVGDLIDGILDKGIDIQVVANEIDPKALEILKIKYRNKKFIKIQTEDVLLNPGNTLFDYGKELFDRVIANPPYGGWQNKGRRQFLKNIYPSLYVKETYGVFMFACFNRLKVGGRMVFIVPDTFLWLNRHEYLRRYLFTSGRINEIALFQSKFFPGVSFGYSGMCIISIEKVENRVFNKFRVIYEIKKPEILTSLANGNAISGFNEKYFDQEKVLGNKHCIFAFQPPQQNGKSTTVPLGNVADVVTGFYSGNDKTWVRRGISDVRKADRYQSVDFESIYRKNVLPSLEGIAEKKCFVPIVRGGAGAFIKPTRFYVDWSRKAVLEYKRRGKNPARFQNSKFYFSEGLAVPMVASTKLTAALLENRLFDQSIVGVFPKDKSLIFYILGFFNTKLATELLRAINPTANNSANYLKRLPFVAPDKKTLKKANEIVWKIIRILKDEKEVERELLQELEDFYRYLWS